MERRTALHSITSIIAGLFVGTVRSVAADTQRLATQRSTRVVMLGERTGDHLTDADRCVFIGDGAGAGTSPRSRNLLIIKTGKYTIERKMPSDVADRLSAALREALDGATITEKP
jgi:hypothetical protein